MSFYPFPKRQVLDSSKLKEFADDNFSFGENGRKSSKRVENTVGKGEIYCYKQFPTVFSKDFYADTLKPGLVWERVKSLPNDKILNQYKLKTCADDRKF